MLIIRLSCACGAARDMGPRIKAYELTTLACDVCDKQQFDLRPSTRNEVTDDD